MRNVSFDLITGLPGYTMAKLKDTMDKVITLAPNHISIYSLILEEGTPLSQLVAKGRVELPDEEADRAMQAYARDHLAAAGSVGDPKFPTIPNRGMSVNIIYLIGKYRRRRLHWRWGGSSRL